VCEEHSAIVSHRLSVDQRQTRELRPKTDDSGRKTDGSRLATAFVLLVLLFPIPASAAELQGMSAFAADVPEPSAMMTLVFAGAGVMLRRTRRRT